MQKVVITIDKFGRANASAQGFLGGACKPHIEKISGLLGATEQDVTDKPEMYVSTDNETETETDQYAT